MFEAFGDGFCCFRVNATEAKFMSIKISGSIKKRDVVQNEANIKTPLYSFPKNRGYIAMRDRVIKAYMSNL